jgi:hypothetical protein
VLSPGSSAKLRPRRSETTAPITSFAFTNRRVITLVRPDQLARGNKTPLIATCISGSGETVGLVAENVFWIYRLSSGHLDTVRARFEGRFEKDGRFKSGLAYRPLRDHGHIMSRHRKVQFACAAITDDLLVIGGADYGYLLFSIGEDDAVPCRCIFKHECAQNKVRKIFFNTESTELVVLFSCPGSKTEVCHIYSTMQFENAPREGPVPVVEASDQTLCLDMTYQIAGQVYTYSTRDAKFSFDGSKIVTCTDHIYGSALVFILTKTFQNRWQISGRHLLVNQKLDINDEDCLGYTSVSL